ncbi:hypothetical protein EMPS_03265 [Entomortierella parvispora]|uniref:Uncharacterized protein n=1 Tax=Entomortierella parvispora TaxID=205924 RepID=A0A9P3LUQ6_9FUNG|nr:hypothetical protein EMPS_03265 [Entomortierella parvispora]
MPFERFSDDEWALSPRPQRHAIPSRTPHSRHTFPRTLTTYQTHRVGLSQSNNSTTFNFQSKSITHFAQAQGDDNVLQSSAAVAASYNSNTMTFHRHRHLGSRSNLSQSQHLYSRQRNSTAVNQRLAYHRQAPLVTMNCFPSDSPPLVSAQDWANFVHLKAKPSSSSGSPSTSIHNDGVSGEKMESISRVDQTFLNPKPSPAAKAAEVRPPLQILLDLDDTTCSTGDIPAPLPAALKDLLGLDFTLCQDERENLLDKEMTLLSISEPISTCNTGHGNSLSFGPGEGTTPVNDDDRDHDSDNDNGDNSSSDDDDDDLQLAGGDQDIISLQKLDDLRDNLKMRCLVWSDLLDLVKL